MIFGNGMLATAFKYSEYWNDDACVFASGVSNSKCNEPSEFNRESSLLVEALTSHKHPSPFVYFGTCSVYDPVASSQAYVLHKLEMEKLVNGHPSGLVVRLPQVAGPNPSPYTLLTVLCNSVRQGKEVNVWEFATRNIIDVIDVEKIVSSLVFSSNKLERTIDVANPESCKVLTIVKIIESVFQKKAKLNILPLGASYEIDTLPIQSVIEALKIDFGDNYLSRVIARYYL